jgi:hypothetical protein
LLPQLLPVEGKPHVRGVDRLNEQKEGK